MRVNQLEKTVAEVAQLNRAIATGDFTERQEQSAENAISEYVVLAKQLEVEIATLESDIASLSQSRKHYWINFSVASLAVAISLGGHYIATIRSASILDRIESRIESLEQR